MCKQWFRMNDRELILLIFIHLYCMFYMFEKGNILNLIHLNIDREIII